LEKILLLRPLVLGDDYPFTSANATDSDMNEHVKTALNQNSALKAFDIQVITLKGDVR
jgi:osmotically-inducible protein OsmY